MIGIMKLHNLHIRLGEVKILRFIYNRYREIKISLRDYSLFAEKNDNCLIYMADGKIRHGGLADRLYGIINAFAFCKARNIPFKIYFVYPFDIRVFLVPNRYDWTIENDKISYNVGHSKVMIKIQENGWHKTIDSQKQIHFYCNTKNLDEINTYYNTSFTYDGLFAELFRPSERLQEKLAMIIQNRYYVGIQFRFMDLLGDFNEGRCTHTLSMEEREILLDICYNYLRQYAEYVQLVFLASDSIFFIESMVKKMDNIFFISGNSVHMDRKSNVSLEAHEKTFLDFFVLGSASKIIKVHGCGLYRNSGFSKLVSELFNKPLEVVCLEDYSI